MNIFFLSMCINNCIIYYNDKHVVKMILEYAQMLCTCHRILDFCKIENEIEPYNQYLYKITHKNHPCNVWLRESSENYNYLFTLFIKLCQEYSYRYNKEHLCHIKFKDLGQPLNIKDGPLTVFPMAIPNYIKDKYIKYTTNNLLTIKNRNKYVVLAYREYYICEKNHIAKWKNRSIPHWYRS